MTTTFSPIRAALDILEKVYGEVELANHARIELQKLESMGGEDGKDLDLVQTLLGS